MKNNGTKAMAVREYNAGTRFVEYAMEHAGLSEESAERVLAAYRKAKVIRLDKVDGQFYLKHGVFGDVETMVHVASEAV